MSPSARYAVRARTQASCLGLRVDLRNGADVRFDDLALAQGAVALMVNIAELLVGVVADRWRIGCAAFGTTGERCYFVRQVDGDG